MLLSGSFSPKVIPPRTLSHFRILPNIILRHRNTTRRVKVLLPRNNSLIKFRTKTRGAKQFSQLKRPYHLSLPSTVIPQPSPFRRKVPLTMFSINRISRRRLITTMTLTHVMASRLSRPFTHQPHLLAQQMVITRLFLQPSLIFREAPLRTMNSKQGTTALRAFVLRHRPFPIANNFVRSNGEQRPIILRPKVRRLRVNMNIKVLYPHVHGRSRIRQSAILIRPSRGNNTINTTPVKGRVSTSSPPSIMN